MKVEAAVSASWSSGSGAAAEAAAHPDAVGRPYPHVETAVVDPASGLPLEGEATGELWVRGPSVFRGYLHDDEATARAKLAKRITWDDLGGPSGAVSLVVEHAGVPVGDVILWLTDRERGVAEIGWALDPRHAGQGFAREAAAALLDLGFETSGLHRVVAQMDARNTASARLAETLGMRREAHHRQDLWSKGEWTDTLVYAMLASDRG